MIVSVMLALSHKSRGFQSNRHCVRHLKSSPKCRMRYRIGCVMTDKESHRHAERALKCFNDIFVNSIIPLK